MRTKRALISLLVCAVALVFGVAALGCSSGSGSGSSSASSQAASASSSTESTSAESASSSSQETVESSQASSAASGESSSSAGSASAQLAPGEYTVKVDTGSSMFHVNEADEGTGTLTVTDEGMSVYIRLASKKIVNVYAGTAEQAKADPEGVIQPKTDTVTYSDGMQKEVYGFDIPVPAIDQEFDVAILGTKGNWYTHTVTVSDPVAK